MSIDIEKIYDDIGVDTTTIINRSIAIKGLTNSYELTRGDRLSVSIGSGSELVLLEVAEDVTATATGEEFAVLKVENET